jgi:hypothetical protein
MTANPSGVWIGRSVGFPFRLPDPLNQLFSLWRKPRGKQVISAPRLWGSLGVALGWLCGGSLLPSRWLCGRLRVALSGLCTPESVPSLCLVYGFVVALLRGIRLPAACLPNGFGVVCGWLRVALAPAVRKRFLSLENGQLCGARFWDTRGAAVSRQIFLEKSCCQTRAVCGSSTSQRLIHKILAAVGGTTQISVPHQLVVLRQQWCPVYCGFSTLRNRADLVV